MSWPAFGGELRRAELADYVTDFGREVTATPAAVLRPAHLEDVLVALRFARRDKLRVVARGQGHTTRGQTLTEGGIVVDLRSLDRVLEVGSGFARVQAGARWRDVLAATLTTGQTPPVLTDYIDLTVGGTLSVGGVGGQSFRHGLQLDNVLELVVATGAGELVRCSPTANAALFDACRGGLGQFGLIVEATLRLEPAPREVEVLKLSYATLASFLHGQLRLANDGRFGYLVGNLTRADAWRFDVDCVHYGPAGADVLAGLDYTAVLERRRVPYFDFANRLEAMVAAMRRSGAWQAPHPWIDLFVPASAASSIIEATLGELERPDVADGYVMTYPLVRRRCASAFPGLPDEDWLFLFDVLPSLRAPRLAPFVEKCHRLVERARRAGATVYPIGYPVGTEWLLASDWQRQLGPAVHARLAQLKRETDPDGILGASLAVF